MVGRTVARRWAGYGAAGALAMYLLVKAVWVVVALGTGRSPMHGMSTGEWVVLNVVTVGMAAVGIGLGLALAGEWGLRLPAAPVLLFAWLAAGLLVSTVPFSLLGSLLKDGGGDGGGDDGASAPSWEGALITVGFAGMAIGVAIALPIYLRERWPAALTGRVGTPQITPTPGPTPRDASTPRPATTARDASMPRPAATAPDASMPRPAATARDASMP
ncbi:hypothetical protein AB0J52_27650, partial [Spirillospora sp. NPDC049652]